MVGPGRLRRALGVAAVVAIATVGIQLVGTGEAAAHANAVTGIASCATDGTYGITWTIANDYQSAEDVTVSAHDPAASAVTPDSVHIDAVGSGQMVQSDVPGDAQSVTLTVHSVWSIDGFELTNSGTVALDGTCRASHVAAAPTSADGACAGGAPASGSVTIPTDAGVLYTLDGAARQAGTYSVTPGAHDVIATSAVYQLTGTTTFALDVTGPPDTCTEIVQPGQPTVEQAVCTPGSDQPSVPTLSFPVTEGITYWADVTAPYGQGQTVTITATAEAGYVFEVEPPSGWTRQDSIHESYTVTFASTDCVHTVTPQDPTVIQSICSVTGDTTTPSLAFATTPGIMYTATPGVGYSPGQQVVVTATSTGSDSFTAPAPFGWSFVDPTHETYEVMFAPAPSCARANQPTFTDSVCAGAAPARASYTIPSAPGVDYRVGSTLVTAGVHRAVDGATIVVTAVAQPGYTIVGDVTFTHTFAQTPDCRTTVAAMPPTFFVDVCDGATPAGARYTIPSSTGVDYFLGGVRTAAGTFPAPDGSTVTLTAVARGGFVLSGSSVFTFTYPEAPDCTTAVVPAAPSFVDQVCAMGQTPRGASYTIPTTTGVVYLVGGAVARAGTYLAQSGTSIAVTTRALAGYHVSGATGFTHTFSVDPSCTGAAEAVTPSFDPARCAGATPVLGTFTIPATVGVDYLVEIEPSGEPQGSHSAVPTLAGSYDAPQLSTVTITARPQTGFTLLGRAVFTYRFSPAVACGSELIPASATFQDSVCLSATTSSDAAFVIPTSIGALYYVAGKAVDAGPHPWPAGSTVTVEARAANGYSLTGVTEWTYRFAARPHCGETGSIGASNPVMSVGAGTYSVPLGSGSPADTGAPTGLLLTSGVVFLLAGGALILLAGRRRPRRAGT